MPTLWIISDNKPGHLNQSLGLAQALQDRYPSLRLHQLPALPPGQALRALARRRYPAPAGLPAPDLVIATGHRTHLSLLAAGRSTGAQTLVLMKPSLPLAWFDHCLIPAHDAVPPAPNLITTDGPLNRIRPGEQHDKTKGLILIGGPSRHFDWSDRAIQDQVLAIVARSPQIHWTLTSSRRTPARFLDRLRDEQPDNLTLVPAEQTDAHWLPQQLAQNGLVWVSDDSASMVYEALSAGGAVGILQGIEKAPNRITRGLQQLAERGLVTRFGDWQKNTPLRRPKQAFNEARRCAQLIAISPQSKTPHTGSRPLKVIQFLPDLHNGGVERGTLEVAEALVNAGHQSLVVSAGGPMVAELEAQGSRHIHWDLGKKSLLTLRHIWSLRRWLTKQQADILHVRSRLPAWIVYLAWKGMDPASRPRLVSTVHGMNSVSRYSAIMSKGERVIAVSDTVRAYVLEHYPSTDPARIQVIYRGVDPAAFARDYQPDAAWLQQWRDDYPQLEHKWVLTLPGRLTRLKGHHDFIAIIEQLKTKGIPVAGLIVGGEDRKRKAYAEELYKTVAERGLADDIIFTGQRNDIRAIYTQSQMVLSLSTKPESFGRTVLEALSQGVPVLGYNHGGVGEILSNLYAEGAIPLRDIDAAVTRLETIYRRNKRPVIAENSRYLKSAMLEQTLQLYISLISANTGISSR